MIASRRDGVFGEVAVLGMVDVKYRKMRIAWSVGWCVVAALLCALWVRSANCFDDAGWIASVQGRVYFYTQLEFVGAAQSYMHFRGMVTTIHSSNVRVISMPGAGAVIPYWLPVLATTLFAAAPWLKWRFSVRALLIATGLLAVILGVAVATN